MLFTPNGRFQVNTKICLSNSDFHPESWSPFWSVNNLLTGFVSFMTEESHGLGSISSTSYHRKLLAKQSLTFNCKNIQFKKLFPKYYKLYQQQKRLNPSPSTSQSSLNNNNDNNNKNLKANANANKSNIKAPQNRDKIFDWLVICLVIMAIAYGWKMLMQ